MTTRALRVCTQHGCTTLVRGGRCEAHPYPDIARDNPKYHTAHWRRTRDAKRRAYPLCERCLAEGLTVLMSDVHHIDGDAANDQWDNLESLCHPCHSSHTAREHGGFGNKRVA